MGFSKAPGAQPSAAPADENKSWNNIVKKSDDEKEDKKTQAPVKPAEAPRPLPVSPPPAAAASPAQPRLPKEIQDIIEAAAKASRKEIFKDEKDESGIDAAE